MPLPSAVFLLGPTASGKTDMARRLVEESDIPFEMISVDSAQVYRGMDVGSAKSKEFEDQHLIDIRDPGDPYSAADFREDALSLMKQIVDKGRVPLLVGGTMLYFKVLKDGMSDLPAADADIRKEILDLASEKGWGVVHEQLQAVDAISAARIKPSDTQRLQRALEVYELTGQPLSSLHRIETPKLPYSLVQIGLMPGDRGILHQQIESRFMVMLELGFVDEVKCLYERGDLSADLPAIRAVGYRQIWEYLEGKITQEEMINKCLAATRQLAKRQITWMRGWKGLEIVDCRPYADYEQVLKIATRASY